MEYEIKHRLAITSAIILVGFAILSGVMWTVTRNPQQLLARDGRRSFDAAPTALQQPSPQTSIIAPSTAPKMQPGAATPDKTPTSTLESTEPAAPATEETPVIAPPKKKKPKPQKPRPKFDDVEENGRASRSRGPVFPDLFGIFN
jgi:hypothetical protein